MKKKIKIKFTNGLNFENGIRDILNCANHYYDFIDSDEPDFVIFGPYGNDIPKGNFVKIGYYCENIIPDMTLCDWGFGVHYEEEIKHPKYMRIQWHGFDPNSLIKTNIDVDKILNEKTKFCNFIYSNPVPFREEFFKALTKYKPIDAPGKSMNNMHSIDFDKTKGDIWTRKRKFLNQYKFTIAFENYSYPGYHSEKILDPMAVNSLPIYWGNPFICRHFNTKSFINAHDYLNSNHASWIRFLEKQCQLTFRDALPNTYKTIDYRIKRKIKSIGRKVKIKLQYDAYRFDELIEKIIEVDKDDSLYAKYLLEPWFYDNKPPSNEAVVNRWRKIFDKAIK